MLVPLLDVLGWGRGGLQGAGSSVAGVGDGIVPWDSPVCFPVWRAWAVLIPGVEGPGSWGGDNRPAYLIGHLDGGLSFDDLWSVGFDGCGGVDGSDSLVGIS